MKTLPRELQGSIAIAKKDILIYYVKGPVIIFGVLFPLFLFLAFSVGRHTPAALLVPGLISMTLFFTATSVGPVIAPWETRVRTLERLVSAPINFSAILFGDVLASMIFGVAISGVTLGIGFLMGAQLFHPLTLALGVIIASFCFSCFGILLSSSSSDMPSNVMMVSTLIKFPLIFISGIFIPIEKLPSWGIYLASLSPLTYFTELSRYCLQGESYFSAGLNLIILTVFLVLFWVAAVKFHNLSLPKRF